MARTCGRGQRRRGRAERCWPIAGPKPAAALPCGRMPRPRCLAAVTEAPWSREPGGGGGGRATIAPRSARAADDSCAVQADGWCPRHRPGPAGRCRGRATSGAPNETLDRHASPARAWPGATPVPRHGLGLVDTALRGRPRGRGEIGVAEGAPRPRSAQEAVERKQPSWAPMSDVSGLRRPWSGAVRSGGAGCGRCA